MKNVIFTSLLVALFFVCGAQIKSSTVPQAKAFFTVTAPGILRADENGNAINDFIINRFLYIETTGRQALKINSIKCQGKSYTFQIEEASEKNVVVGNLHRTNLPLKINAAKSNRLWRVSYTPQSGKDFNEAIRNINIKGVAAGKVFKLVLPKDIQLIGPMVY